MLFTVLWAYLSIPDRPGPSILTPYSNVTCLAPSESTWLHVLKNSPASGGGFQAMEMALAPLFIYHYSRSDYAKCLLKPLSSQPSSDPGAPLEEVHLKKGDRVQIN